MLKNLFHYITDKKTASTFLCLGVTAGFIIGTFDFLNYISINRYVEYEMFRLVGLAFPRITIRWLAISIIASLVIFSIWVFLKTLYLLITKHRHKKMSNSDIAKKRNGGFLTASAVIKNIALTLFVLFAALSLAVVIYDKVNIPKGPNVILISVDALRPDHLSCYGYKKNTTPNIDKFAAESLLFKNCFSHAPSTTSSYASLLSGYLPHETKATMWIPISLSINTLAEFLRNKGYVTIGIVSNYVLRKRLGFEQGFDIYDDRMEDEELVRKLPERIAEKTTRCVIDFLKKYRRHKFFMWVHYQDPHGPYTPPPPFNEMFFSPKENSFELKVNDTVSGKGAIPSYQRLGRNRDYNYYVSQYDGEIRYFDEHFKNLIAALKQTGLYDNSLIIFTADHGEGMGGHSYYFAHGEYLYNSLIHVPLIIRYKKWPPEKIGRFVQHIDLLPTIFKTIGEYIDLGFRGSDLCDKDFNKRAIFSGILSKAGLTTKKASVITDGFKLIYTHRGKEYALYNMLKDCAEQDNVIDDVNYAESAEGLKEKMGHILNEDLLGLPEVEEKPSKFSAEEKERLRSLGYIN